MATEGALKKKSVIFISTVLRHFCSLVGFVCLVSLFILLKTLDWNDATEKKNAETKVEKWGVNSKMKYFEESKNIT